MPLTIETTSRHVQYRLNMPDGTWHRLTFREGKERRFAVVMEHPNPYGQPYWNLLSTHQKPERAEYQRTRMLKCQPGRDKNSVRILIAE